MNQEPIKKRKLTEAEKGMAKSLSMKDKPLTAAEKMQADRDYKKLKEESRRLNPTTKNTMSFSKTIVGKDMSKIPKVAKKLMELKAKYKK